MNETESVCSGMKDEKRCSKLISSEAISCSHCESSDIDSIPAPLSSNESENESSGDKNSNENHDNVIMNKELDTPPASDVIKSAQLKRSCRTCGEDVENYHKFCTNCGHKITAPCLGTTKGNPCTIFLSCETKFCPNCGTENSNYITETITDLGEEKNDEMSTTDLSAENSEEICEEIGSKDGIIKEILDRIKTKGVINTTEYLTEQAMQWKRAKVKFAVAGQSTAGKSAFINAIRGVKHNDEGYAKEGFGDTTMDIEEYVHPKNKQIIYCDLPGYGTTTITRRTFLKKVNISDYDMFIIFFIAVPTTDDNWMVSELHKSEIPVCFVRTKLDQDIENGKRMGKNAKTVINEIKDTIARATKSMPVLKNEPKFIISNYQPHIGDMSKLFQFMEERVSKIKFEAIMRSIPAFTGDIIDKKYQDLLSRMTITNFLFAIMSDYKLLPTSRIKDEIKMYFRTFELDTDYARNVPGLQHYFNDKHILKLIEDLKGNMPSVKIQYVPIYSMIQTYKVYKSFLSELLYELKMDANKMYLHMTRNV